MPPRSDGGGPVIVELGIVLGNKRYSSWSLRGWLAVKLCGVPFDEVVIPLRRSDTKARILEHSPSGKVPALRAEGVTIWDTLAIAEYLAERFPEAGIWPEDPAARAVARAVSAEMHAGFPALRRHMPVDLCARHPGKGRAPGVAEEIARIVALWSDCRARFGRGGDFLFGDYSFADAAYAPVATRFVTYDVALPEAAAAYRDAVLAWPAMAEWTADAAKEPWVMTFPNLDE